MKQIMKYTITNCISFTILMLLYALLEKAGSASPLTVDVMLDFLVITTVISVLMYLSERFLQPGVLLGMALDIAIIFLVVFGLGSLAFNMFPFTWQQFIVISGMILITYFAVYGFMVIKEQRDAERINESIQKRKRDRHA